MPQESPAKTKILLIDDEELVLKSVTKLLEKEGYEVETCLRGDEALRKAQKKNFDLIVCDLRMPSPDGIETLKRLRALYQEKKRQAPEIVITGYADERMNREVEHLQVAEYLLKPFDLRQFLAAVKKALKT